MQVAEFREMQAKAMREEDLAAEVVRLCKHFDVLRYHTYRSVRSEAGFPDEVLIGTRTLFRELKRVGKSPTPAQARFLRALSASGQDAGVWTPTDLLSGRIQAEIAAISPRH